ncbi:hypothetical protein NP233_g11394 [Leucocoprinus birnbaumii]|uniref:Uncharacterized protein n=1 Tax=Leucocoprinus birnbaumii TaxID=56174 RepID=A0AAD5YLB7_9AGAR|nr:hypothetical protein NP233_g11394 [Leucocoprinus birnbaumii]
MLMLVFALCKSQFALARKAAIAVDSQQDVADAAAMIGSTKIAVEQPTPMTEMIVPSSNGDPSAVEEAQPENKGFEQETTRAQKVDHEVAKGEEQNVSPPA